LLYYFNTLLNRNRKSKCRYTYTYKRSISLYFDNSVRSCVYIIQPNKKNKQKKTKTKNKNKNVEWGGVGKGDKVRP